ncbi:hypothetical protein D9615_008548 [Tricholomella constricta]|uniref:Major facilitator superfamily (MFS) profile domain-containing protein n=1 Tax=Tricholomella constricta TaxID=117010 RepID=A0A8H5M0E4_9AGAR|nr:hypothetical protein D9615_008548 [Tricholomella constricta]
MSVAESSSVSESFSKEGESTVSSPVPQARTSALRIQGDAALAVLEEYPPRAPISAAEDTKVRRKIDLGVLPVVLLVYFLQQLDKSSLSYTTVFGIIEDTNLVGSQYSWLSSVVYAAQLVWQPISSYLLVRFPVAKYLFVHVLIWGAIVAITAAAKDFEGLLATRFFLGISEATVAPAFITITQMWWRRREQTMRLSMWMAMNGVTGMAIGKVNCEQVGSLLSYGLAHIKGSLRPYQTIFLFNGLLTVVCSPVVLFVLSDSPTKARFLNREEKIIALERLRENNQGTESKVWKWDQVLEVLVDPKTYLWFSLLFICAVPSGGIGAFGPLIIQGFGFNQFHTILFNIPFSAFQVIVTLLAAFVSTKIKLKWPIIFALTLPPIAGASALLVLDRGPELRHTLLGCYYVLSFFTALQPMLYTWSAQNTAGHTKKTCTTGLIFVAQCAGNIIGPLLYQIEDKPFYHRGLVAKITAAFLAFRNRQHAGIRLSLGKAADIVDMSLEKHTKTDNAEQAFDDLTDSQNEDFIFAL